MKKTQPIRVPEGIDQARDARPRARRAAFTLFEILIVIALIALLATVAIVNVDKLFGGGQEDIARIFVNDSTKPAFASFKIHMGRYPTTSEGLKALFQAPDSAGDRWRGPYVEKIPDDPWKHPYQYRSPGTKNPNTYDLFSMGPDGLADTADDIGNW